MFRAGMRQITLLQGDITKVAADAVVNAANAEMRGGGGVDGAIHDAAGPAVMAELRALMSGRTEVPTGSCVVTRAGRLRAKWILHAVGPIWRGGSQGEADELRETYRHCLLEAARLGARTIAFPSISTGAYGFPVEKAAPIAIRAVAEGPLPGESLADVTMVLFSASDLRHYEDAARAVLSASH